MNRSSISACFAFLILSCGASPVLAQTAVAPSLGSAGPFAVLGGSGVTCVGPGTINGDVGSGGALTPGTCTISGSSTTPVAAGVGTAFSNAFSAMDTQNPVCTGIIPPGGGSLSPGVWCSDAGVTIAGTITLSGNASDVWVFRVGTGAVPGALTLTNAQVVMAGTALACNVYWKTSAGATMTDSIFNGTVLSGAAVTMTDGSWNGRAMATSAVSLTRPAQMSFAGCSAPATITVNKDFVPNNAATVPVSLSCTSGTVTTAPATISEAAPAVFRVGGASLAGATCTATETVPTGYTASQAGCVNVALNGSCTIINTFVPPTCPVITLDPAALPNGGVGIAYSQVMTGHDGDAPYTFGVTSGALPPGLTLTAAGLLAGTPTTAGTTVATIRATDANGCFVERAYTMVIVTPPATCPAITLSPTALANGAVGTPYSQTITASGGTAPYVFTTAANTLPAGLRLSTAGVLSGTPTTAVPQTFTVRATDSFGCFAVLTFTVTIVESGAVPPPAIPPAPGTCPAITLFPATLPAAVVGAAYSQTLTASGGTAPYVFTTTAADLPAGMSLTSAGVLAGTPTSATPQTFTVRGTDALGCFGEKPFSIVFGVAVPTMPQVLYLLLAFSLLLMGYRRLRNYERPTA